MLYNALQGVLHFFLKWNCLYYRALRDDSLEAKLVPKGGAHSVFDEKGDVVLGDLGEALGEDYHFVAGAPVHHTQLY